MQSRRSFLRGLSALGLGLALPATMEAANHDIMWLKSIRGNGIILFSYEYILGTTKATRLGKMIFTSKESRFKDNAYDTFVTMQERLKGKNLQLVDVFWIDDKNKEQWLFGSDIDPDTKDRLKSAVLELKSISKS